MAERSKQKRRNAAGDPLSDLLDDTDMRGSASRARPRGLQQRHDVHSGVWWIAAAASFVWIASVIAFSWSRYALPGDPGSVFDAARNRIEVTDWMLIATAIVGPLLLIWVIAWLIRRSMELRDESRRLARAAILLADAAEASEQRTEQLLLPAPGGVASGTAPNHLHREIERATHAMGALQTQMTAMEEALSKQSAAFDDAAERTAVKVKTMQSGFEVAAAARPTDTLIVEEDSEPASDSEESGLIVTDVTGSASAAAIDLALNVEEPNRIESLRAGLKAAGEGAGWKKLTDRAPTASPSRTTELQEIRRDVDEIQESADKIDPFDDLGPAVARAGSGAGAAAGAALAFGADRSDAFSTPIPDSRLDSAIADDPGIFKPSGADAPVPHEEDFEFMARALDWEKFVRAANFPENERDTETLDALYDVLTDPEAAALLQSAEDTLATLADLDLYMEDFVPEMSPVTAWRAHLNGASGEEDAHLLGIDAPIEQSRIDAKLTSDNDFEKLTQRFTERFTVVMKRLFTEAGNDRLALDLADSRTGRAYLLLARPLGKL